MSTRAKDILFLTAFAAVARAVAAMVVDWPPYTDPAYYHLAAERLASGHGFTLPVIWSFLEVGGQLPSEPSLPVPSFGHWMPLTSLIAAASMAVLGPTWVAGQVPVLVLSVALVSMTYLIGWWLFGTRLVPIVAAALMIFAGPLLLMFPTTDNFAVFGVLGAGALASAVQAVRANRPGHWLIVSGALVGLATLARVDGVLLAIATAVAWLEVAPRGRSGSAWLAHVGTGVLAAAAFLAALGPWLVRNISVFGSPLPSTGGNTLWISTYNEQFSIGQPITVETYLASGWENIVGSKLFAIAELAARTASLMGGIFAILFVAGSWIAWRRRELRPFLAYFWAMFAVMAFVFTFHAPRGAFYHSAPAWLPFALAVGVASIGSVAGGAGRIWPFLRRPQTHRFLAVAGLCGAVVLSVVGSAILYEQWAVSRERDERAAAFLEDHAGTDDVVMSTDPASIHYFSRHPAVAVPFDPFPVIERVVDAYAVRWIIVMRPGPGEPDPLGMWDGAASTDRHGNEPSFLPEEPAYDSHNLRIFDVGATDRR